MSNYCNCCGSAAKEAGRPVRKTDVYPHEIFPVCEARIRNGLVHYKPSNGTEFGMFYRQCSRCFHHIADASDDYPNSPKPTVPGNCCQWAILDKLYIGMIDDSDTAALWFDPADIDAKGCPATCRRFTHRDDGDREFRTPPKPDCEGQMFFGDVIPEPVTPTI